MTNSLYRKNEKVRIETDETAEYPQLIREQMTDILQERHTRHHYYRFAQRWLPWPDLRALLGSLLFVVGSSLFLVAVKTISPMMYIGCLLQLISLFPITKYIVSKGVDDGIACMLSVGVGVGIFSFAEMIPVVPHQIRVIGLQSITALLLIFSLFLIQQVTVFWLKAKNKGYWTRADWCYSREIAFLVRMLGECEMRQHQNRIDISSDRMTRLAKGETEAQVRMNTYNGAQAATSQLFLIAPIELSRIQLLSSEQNRVKPLLQQASHHHAILNSLIRSLHCVALNHRTGLGLEITPEAKTIELKIREAMVQEYRGLLSTLQEAETKPTSSPLETHPGTEVVSADQNLQATKNRLP